MTARTRFVLGTDARRAARAARAAAAGGAVVVVAMAALVGCTSTETPAATTPAPVPMVWHRVALPGGVTPVTVTAMDGDLLVGARDEHAHLAPRLLIQKAAGWRSVPLHPASYYAYRARWRTVVTDGRIITAVGDAPGGAHSNPRWTVWSGTVDGVTEHPQTFETFGGWGAGGLTALTLWQQRPVIIGSWSSDTAGLDMVTWTSRGPDWQRHSSTGTALASTHEGLNVLRAVGDDLGGNVIAGAVTRLGGGEVGLTPALWRRTPEAPAWTRIDLQAEGESQATGVACQATSCLAAGYDGDRLAVWSIEDGSAHAAADVPALPVSDQSVALVGPAGAARPAVLTTSGGRSLVIQQTADGWRLVAGPPGTPTAWLEVHGRTYVVTAAAGGGASLWVGDLDRAS